MTHMLRIVAALILLIAGVALGAEPAAAPRDALVAGKPLFDKPQKAAIIKLDREVNDMMERSINRRIDLARKAGCTLIVFEMDTYGGLVTSGINISKLVKKLPGENLHTVAWVNTKAISAGALISVACEKIVMSSHSSIGDCGVIAVDVARRVVQLNDHERAKFESPVVDEMDDSARSNGYDPNILRAMVVTRDELYAMHNFQTGEWRFVGKEEKDRLLALEVEAPGANAQRPWKYDRQVDEMTTLLTVDPEQALQMKISSANVEDQRQLAAALNIEGDPLVLGYSWAEIATIFLSTTYIRLMLFVGMLVFAWLEAAHPGVSVFGIAALICLVLLVGAPFLTGLAQVWEIALIILGLALILVDLFLFGGLGMIAIPGFILLAIGLVASFVPAGADGGLPTGATAWNSVGQGLGVLVGGSFLAIAAFWFLSKYLHMTPGLNRIQLAPAGGMSPEATTPPLEIRDASDRLADEAVFVGAIGMATSDLRPAGKAAFGDHIVAVESFSTFIDRGTEVVVTEILPMRVVVRPYSPPNA